MNRYFLAAVAIPAFVSCFAATAVSQTARIIFYCPGGQGQTTSTNIVIRNYPLPSNNTTLVVKRIIIYNQDGKLLYNKIPAGLTPTVSPGLATGFSTKDVLSPNTGRVSILVSTTVSGSASLPAEVLAANLDTDASGNVTSRDTVLCSK